MINRLTLNTGSTVKKGESNMPAKKRFFYVVILSLIFTFMIFGSQQSKKTVVKAEAPPEKYPTKTVELVVPFGAGGSHDLHARAIVSVIPKYLGAPMVVVLKPGGSGAVGSEYVAKSKPNGYTLLFGGSGPNTQLHYLTDLPYKREDFIPIAKINHSPNVIVVKSDSKFKTLKDLVNYAKEHPDELRYSSSGMFGAMHIPTELFLEAAGIKAVHVPFNGGGPALMALLGGHVDFSAPFPTQVKPFVEAGTIRILATTDTQRDPILKDVPTLKELGYNVEYKMWRAVLAPKGTPEAVITKLRNVFREMVKDDAFKQLIGQLGEKIYYLDGPEFAKAWDAEFSAQASTLKRLAEEEKRK